jgi:hypothetical protein
MSNSGNSTLAATSHSVRDVQALARTFVSASIDLNQGASAPWAVLYEASFVYPALARLIFALTARFPERKIYFESTPVCKGALSSTLYLASLEVAFKGSAVTKEQFPLPCMML